MASKLRCHNIVHGPQPIQKNLKLFRELMVFTQIQTAMIGTIVCSKLNLNFQDMISRLFFRLTKFLDKLIWYDNSTTNIISNGLPVKLDFM